MINIKCKLIIAVVLILLTLSTAGESNEESLLRTKPSDGSSRRLLHRVEKMKWMDGEYAGEYSGNVITFGREKQLLPNDKDGVFESDKIFY